MRENTLLNILIYTGAHGRYTKVIILSEGKEWNARTVIPYRINRKCAN